MKLYIIFSCMAAIAIMGCNDTVTVKTGMENTPMDNRLKIGASDIAVGLGMNGFLVAIPDNDNVAQYGFTYITKDGIAGCGYSTFRPGEIVKVIYWTEGSLIRFAIIGKDMTTTSSLSLEGKDKDRYIRTSPSNNMVYKPGDIAAVWSLGNSTDSGNGKDVPLREDSLALGVFRSGDTVKFQFAKAADSRF